MRWGHWSMQTQKHFPRGRCPQSLLPGETNPLGAVFSLGEQPLPRFPSPPWEYLADEGSAGKTRVLLPHPNPAPELRVPASDRAFRCCAAPFSAFSSQHEDQWGSPDWFLWVSHPISPLSEQTSAAVVLELSPRVRSHSQVCPRVKTVASSPGL